MMMQKIKGLASVVLLLVLTTACSHSPSGSTNSLSQQGTGTTTPTLTLAASVDQMTEIEPCGCSISPMGGIDRQYNLLESWRKTDPQLFALTMGKSFAPQYPVALTKALQAKQKTLINAWNLMGLRALGVSGNDLAFGLSAIRELEGIAKFPFVATNVWDVKNKKSAFPPAVTFEANGYQLIVLSLTEGKSTPELAFQHPAEALKAIGATLPLNKRLVVVLSSLPEKTNQTMVQDFPWIDVVVTNVAKPAFGVAMLAPKTIGASPDARGRSIVKLTFDMQPEHTDFYSARLALETESRLARLPKAPPKPKRTAKAQIAAIEREIAVTKNVVKKATAGSLFFDFTNENLGGDYSLPENGVHKLIQNYRTAVRQTALDNDAGNSLVTQ